MYFLFTYTRDILARISVIKKRCAHTPGYGQASRNLNNEGNEKQNYAENVWKPYETSFDYPNFVT